MILSVINPFLLRNARDNFVFAFTKQLEALSSQNVIYVTTKHYINPDLWKKYENQIEFGKLTRIENMNAIVLDDAVLDKIQKDCDQDVFYARYLTEKIPSIELIFEEVIKEAKKAAQAIDAILSWGNCQSLEAVARKNNIPIIYNERAPLRSPLFNETSYFDFRGVNGNTESSRRFETFAAGFLQTPQKLLSRFELQGLVLSNSYKYYRDVFLYKHTPAVKTGVALQVENDSNMLVFSNGYDNYKLIEYAAAKVKKEELLIRKHPVGKNDYAGFGENDNSKNSLEFLLNCRRLLTINSGIALEALLFGIEVDILGDSPFLITDAKMKALLGEKYNDYLLNFFVLNYIVPANLSYDIDYINFRLKKPSESEIFSCHLGWWQAKSQVMHRAKTTELLSNLRCASRYRDVLTICESKSLSFELVFYKQGHEPYSGSFYPFDLSEIVEINIKKEQMKEYDRVKIKFHAHEEIILYIHRFFMKQENTKYNLTHNGQKLENIIMFNHRTPEIEIDFSSVIKDDLCLCVEAQLSNEIGNGLKKRISQLDGVIQEGENRYHQLESNIQILNNECAVNKTKIDELNSSLHYWQTVSGQISQELKNVYNSKSWRITLPFRKITLIVKKICYFRKGKDINC